jgi:hypothetical protein
VLGAEGFAYREAEMVQATLPHRSGELGRAASRLGEAKINLNYAFGGIDPDTNAPLIFLGVAEVAAQQKFLTNPALPP